MIGVCEERRRSQNEAIKGYFIFGIKTRPPERAVFCWFVKRWYEFDLNIKNRLHIEPNILSIAQIEIRVNG